MDKDRYEAGKAVRTEVLGPAYVARSLEKADPFNRPLQELVTEYCWGGIWTRPGLERKTRSLMNLAMLTALNRGHELGLHVKGAVRNGCSREEIQEALLQATIYAGVPAGVEAFRIASAALKELEAETAAEGAGTVPGEGTPPAPSP